MRKCACGENGAKTSGNMTEASENGQLEEQKVKRRKK